jgi:hypothetical protein
VLVEKPGELIVHGQVNRERNDGAIVGDPQRAAVRPLDPVGRKWNGGQLKVVRQQQVVVGHKGDELACRLAQRNVPIRVAEAGCLRQIEPPDARVPIRGHDFAGVVGAPVANDQKFEIGVSLSQYGVDGEAQDIGSVMSWQQDREAGAKPYQPGTPARE